MPDIIGGGGNRAAPTQDRGSGDVIHQLELKHALPLNIYLGMEYASLIKTSIVFGNSVQPRIIKGFFQVFWHVYHYVKTSVDAEKLTPDTITACEMWFDMMQGQSRNTELLKLGVDLFLDFVKDMERLGIGRLFSEPINPPFSVDNDPDLLMFAGKGG
jgi:hypothetical protein